MYRPIRTFAPLFHSEPKLICAHRSIFLRQSRIFASAVNIGRLIQHFVQKVNPHIMRADSLTEYAMRTTPILSGFQLVLICLLMFGQLHPAFADPIHDGAARGDVQAIEQALATGADIDKRDDKGRAALHVAVLFGQTGSLGFLLDNGADIEAGKSIGWKPLHAAGRWNRLEAMALLLDNGANIDAGDDYGGTALHLSALVGKPGAVSLLLMHGAATDVQMLDGSTALHWAAYGGNIEIITELLAHNANPNIRNAEGLTPYEMAEKYGHEAAAMLIEKAMVAGNA